MARQRGVDVCVVGRCLNLIEGPGKGGRWKRERVTEVLKCIVRAR